VFLAGGENLLDLFNCESRELIEASLSRVEAAQDLSERRHCQLPLRTKQQTCSRDYREKAVRHSIRLLGEESSKPFFHLHPTSVVFQNSNRQKSSQQNIHRLAELISHVKPECTARLSNNSYGSVEVVPHIQSDMDLFVEWCVNQEVLCGFVFLQIVHV